MAQEVATLGAIPAMTPEAIDYVSQLEKTFRELPQIEIKTTNTIHGGMYARTVKIPAGCMITGALIKIATMLIISGDVVMFVGKDTWKFKGYHVLPAEPGRKQAFAAVKDTWLTMLFPTAAKTVTEAECEFTDESDMLLSRLSKGE